ncbi:hypothetical protein ACIRO3_23970 [Streptomyces sp. NPDC102278]|uniref:hypothetical protein n=1 Tax=Streptomyces sp. NPDC102278 TaxID=3366152 RepID=UPI003827C05A
MDGGRGGIGWGGTEPSGIESGGTEPRGVESGGVESGGVGLIGGTRGAGTTAVAEGTSAGALFVLVLEDGTEAFAGAVAEQLDAVALWWRRSEAGRPGFVTTTHRDPVVNRHDVERFLEASRIREAGPDVPVVLFVTGHGLTSAATKHYTVLRDTDRARLLATGLRTTEIVIAALDSSARDVLVIVNMCESADIGGELLDLRRDLAADRTASATLNVLATAAPKETVLGGAFALILRRAHEDLRSSETVVRRYLTMAEFHRALETAAAGINAEQGRSLYVPAPVLSNKLYEPTPALPNPGYRPNPSAAQEARREVAITLDDMDYWLEKASGRTNSVDPGWYFSGRQHLNAAVVAFLSGPAGVLIVSGTTASGKSAVLGRAVTLSDASFRQDPRFARAASHCPPDTVPGEGAVTVAVTARNREPLSLLRTIGEKLGASPDPAGRDRLRRWQGGLRSFLGRPGPMVTVVVDSLDEAVDPASCIDQVLAPLAGHLEESPAVPAQLQPSSTVMRRVRLVVAVRSHGEHALGAEPETGGDLLSELREAFPGSSVVRTDDSGMREDIEAYVRALLHGATAWKGVDLAVAARTIAAASPRSFLDARVAAEQLRGGGPVLLADPDWLAGLHRGTAGLLAEDLERAAEDGLPVPESLALLRACAFSPGRGIPRGPVWSAVASALLRRPLEDAEEKVRLLLGGRLAGYLTRDTEDDYRVYRPAHDRLSAVLRRRSETAAGQGGGTVVTSEGEGTSEDGPDEYEAHARIAEALARLVGPFAHVPPEPYVRRYLARHARLGRVLDDEHVPAELLPWVTGSPIRGLLPSAGGNGPRHWLQAWASVEPYLHQADFASRLASLYLAYAGLADQRVSRPRRPPRAGLPGASPMAVLWSRWRPPSNVLASLDSAARSLAVLTLPDNRTVLAAGDDDGHIELIDAVAGTAIGERIAAHEGSVRCLTVAARPGQSDLLVSGSTDGTVRFWDPTRGTAVDRLNRPGDIWIDDVDAYVDADREAVAVCADGNGNLVSWMERFGREERLSLPGETPRTAKLALAAWEDESGRSLVAVADGARLSFQETTSYRTVRSFDLSSAVRVLTRAGVRGRIAAGHVDGTVTVWGTAGCLTTLTGATGPVGSLACVPVGDRHLLAAGSGKDIALWDTQTDDPATFLTGHTAAITALEPLLLDDTPTLASAAADGTLRLWNAGDLTRALAGALTTPGSRGGVLAHGAAARSAGLALGGDGPGIDIVEVTTGTTTVRIDTGAPTPALAWAPEGFGRTTLLWADSDHSVRFWDAADGRTLPHRLAGHIDQIRSLAPLTTRSGRHLLLTGSDDYTVNLWDLDGRRLLHTGRGHGLRVRCVAAASDGDRDWYASASSDGTVRLWDTEAGGMVGAPLKCDQGRVHAVAVNVRPTGGLGPHLASAGDDGTVRLWDLATRSPLGEALTGHTAVVHALALWSVEGQGNFVASASGDGTIRVWNAISGACVLQLATGSPVRSLSARVTAAPSASVVLSFAGDAGAAAVELDLAMARHDTTQGAK